MDVLKRIGNAAVVPVVVLDRAEDAVPAARALLAGGIDVMEITFRTAAGRDAIAAVARECPEMLVGAGTVLNVAQGREAVEAGAKFIVSPGFSRELIDECAAQGIPALPGCATPSEIMDALDARLKIVKFFPANVYGGLDAMKALASAFVGVKFMPTGGINAKNLAEYLSAPFIHAVGGTWLCSRTDIAAHNFDRITALCREARMIALGYELAHVGVNTDGRASALEISGEWEKMFGFAAAEGNSSCFAGTEIEVMNRRYLGENGHIGIATRSMERAIDDMEKRGFSLDMDTAKYSGERIKAVYLKNEIGGFAVHLMQK